MGRAHRVGRTIAARYLSWWRSESSEPRSITMGKAAEAFQHWDQTGWLLQWPKDELQIACATAAELIADHPDRAIALLGSCLLIGLKAS